MPGLTEQIKNHDSPFMRQWRKEFREQGERLDRELRIKRIKDELCGVSLTLEEADKLKSMIDARANR